MDWLQFLINDFQTFAPLRPNIWKTMEIKWRTKRTLTKGDIAKFCSELSELFSSNFHGEYKFRPLRRCEGGIECNMWPGRRPKHYKQIRFHHLLGIWPKKIETDWPEVWASAYEKDIPVAFDNSQIYERRRPPCDICTVIPWNSAERVLLKRYMLEANVLC